MILYNTKKKRGLSQEFLKEKTIFLKKKKIVSFYISFSFDKLLETHSNKNIYSSFYKLSLNEFVLAMFCIVSFSIFVNYQFYYVIEKKVKLESRDYFYKRKVEELA